MKLEFEQVTRSLEEAEAALSMGDFEQLHNSLQQTTQLLDTALNHINESLSRLSDLHGLQQSFDEPIAPYRAPQDETEEELMVA